MSSVKPIRVLVADDSAFMRTAMARMIESDSALEVAGFASNGIEALEQIAQLKPDVVTLDIEMPRMTGLEVLRKVMPENPLPVIMISSLTQDGAEATLEAFDLGAFECIPKQLSYASLDIIKIRDQLVAKIKVAACSFVRKPRIVGPSPKAPARRERPGVRPAVVALGTSTGGPKALQQILPMLPADLPVGVLIVQHMPPGFTGPFARRLDTLCSVTVREANNEETIEAGTVLIAPAGMHMTVYRRTHSRYAVRLAKTPADTPHMPSVDVLMHSVADTYGALAMGVIMTGMGCDGALGLKHIREKGGYTIGQDEESCAVYGMPRSCAEMGILQQVLPLEHIPQEIVQAVRAKAA